MSVAATRTPLETVIDALAARGKRPRGGDHGWSAQCPAHEDSNPSLSIGTGNDGRVLVHCHAGCPTTDILQALDLGVGDLFTGPRTNGNRRIEDARYRYVDENNTHLFDVIRYWTDQGKTFRQQAADGTWTTRGIRKVLYRLPQLVQAVADNATVFIVEGEKDVHTIERAGYPATTNPGGVGKWSPNYNHYFTGADVVIVADRDDPGRGHAQHIATQLADVAASVRLARAAEGKDVTDHIRAGHGIEDLILTLQEDDELVEDAPDQDAETIPGSSWTPTPLRELLNGLQAGTISRPQPTIGRLIDGSALYYPGRVNGLYGESGKGKSWIALALAAETMNDGNTVAWIDIEEPAEGILTRLLDLGVDPNIIDKHFLHFAPEESIRFGRHLYDALDDAPPTFAVIDSTGEALTLEGAGPNNDDEVATWFRTWPRHIANRYGTAALVIDHVIKDPTTRGLFPGGSQRKRAAISGSAFMVDTIKTLGRGVRGVLKLTCAKDRQGTYRQGHKAADFVLDATSDTITWKIEPAVTGDGDAPFRPTHLMERVSRWLEQSEGPGVSVKTVINTVTGNKEALNIALSRLVEEGFVERHEDGQTFRHRSVKPFREDETQ